VPSSLNIVLTGAGSGVGRGLAQSLSRRHRLLLLDINADGLQQTRDSLDDGGRVSLHEVDIGSAQCIEDFAASLGDRRVDVLINNAGLQHVCAVESFPLEKWRALIDIMLTGPFLLSKAMLPRMRQHGFGRIVNIGSIHSLVASPFKSAYVAAKHGLLGMSKVIALETAGADITINTICPAYIRTPLVDAQIQSQARTHGISEQQVVDQIMLEPMPRKKFITIDEIAGTVEFLISETARNITGQTIVIDGGWTAR
jgi:3-hydroxybutyrate dehydrogenase